ncbi:sigma-70 family RNA polymerase sigma factor [Flavihumibacter solisilvae]|uniref:sigma-70 family RNA polymerase sigma factor n=1 Tax=Flavihumibacter solisilvae TaxID=1349421 RepID=UPI000690FAFC|nr:sigma-70 family RNA polymerase sigma factor [Flavihumibacter solisilvae]
MREVPPALTLLSDQEIIERILHGENELYSVIVKRYNRRLYRVGMSIINDDVEIEDAMQVAYMNAYFSLSKFSFKSGFATWLTRIMINECLLRLRLRGRTIILDDSAMEQELQERLPGLNRTPLNNLDNTELKALLERSIRQLPEIYRTVFIMREIEDMHIAEIQDCLDISEVNVKVRLNRAKNMLKELLSAVYDKEELLQFHLDRCNRITLQVSSQVAADRQVS